MSVGQSISRSIKIFMFFLVLLGVGYFVATNYSWVFAKNFEGQILAVEKVGQVQVAIIDNKNTGALFSYAVKLLVKKTDGTEEIITGSSEDRQWSVAQVGECVKARFQPYPPWDLEKAGTYFNVRLVSFIRPCTISYSTNSLPAGSQPAAGSAPQAVPTPELNQAIPTSQPAPVPTTEPAR